MSALDARSHRPWPLSVRLVAATVTTAALVVYIPRVMELEEGGVFTAGVSAALLVVSFVHWVLDRRWSALSCSLSAIALALVAIAGERGASSNDLALGEVARPLVAPLLAASVMPILPWSALAIGFGVMAGPVHAMLYNPFLDPSCESDCHPGRFTIRHLPRWASVVEHVGTWGVALVVTASMAFVPRRRIVLGVVALAAWWELANRGTQMLLLAGAVVAVVLGREVATAILAGLRLRELAAALDHSDDLEQSLRLVTVDPELTVDYLVDDEAVDLVDTSARPNEALVRRDGRPLAVIRSRRSSVDIEALADALNGSARLAFEVERLRTVSAVQAAHLDASRSRIVASGDEARRRLERDIHDGAQQQVLSLGMQLELALLDVGDDVNRRHALELCLHRVGAALAELRAVAHSLRPFPLEIGGLDAALHAVSARAGVPVAIGSVMAERLDEQVEQTVIALAQAAVVVARGPLEIDVTRDDAWVTVRISGTDSEALRSASADRIAAAGGRLATGADHVEVSLPCVS